MITRTSSVLKGFGISMIAGALLLSAPSAVSTGHEVSPGQVDRAARSADAMSPNTFHHWGVTTAVADLDPDTFHHWGVTTTVADLDPDTFHHWG